MVGRVDEGMNRIRAAGLTILLAGILGYVAGVYAPYSGRAFSITAVMVGIALAAIGGESE